MNSKQLFNLMEQEQRSETFSINVAISNLKGGEDVQWTTNFERKCRRLTDKFERDICKFESQWGAINLLVSKMVGLRSECRKSTNPENCTKTLQTSMIAERIKQRKIRAQIQALRRQQTEATRNQRATQRQQGER